MNWDISLVRGRKNLCHNCWATTKSFCRFVFTWHSRAGREVSKLVLVSRWNEWIQLKKDLLEHYNPNRITICSAHIYSIGRLHNRWWDDGRCGGICHKFYTNLDSISSKSLTWYGQNTLWVMILMKLNIVFEYDTTREKRVFLPLILLVVAGTL